MLQLMVSSLALDKKQAAAELLLLGLQALKLQLNILVALHGPALMPITYDKVSLVK